MITTLRSGDVSGIYNIHDEPQMRLGEYFCDNESNRLFVYLRADVDIPKGEAVTSKTVTTITTGLLAAAVDTRVLKFGAAINLNTLFPRVPNQPKEAEYMIVARANSGQSGIVFAHTQREMEVSWDTDDFLLDDALAADATLDVSVPWLVQPATQALDGVIGIAQREIAQGKYFWALVEGIGKAHISAVVAAGSPIYISTNAGEGDDTTTAGTEAYAYTLRGTTSTTVQSNNRQIDVVAACPNRIGIPPYQRIPDQQSYQHPVANP